MVQMCYDLSVTIGPPRNDYRLTGDVDMLRLARHFSAPCRLTLHSSRRAACSLAGNSAAHSVAQPRAKGRARLSERTLCRRPSSAKRSESHVNFAFAELHVQ